MLPSLRALLADIVDYAGLFPPAGLPMREAVAAYARHRASARRWMLSRFICPVLRLEEFHEAAGPFLVAGKDPWPMSLLGRTARTEAGHLAALAEDLDRAGALLDRIGSGVRYEAWETKFPQIDAEDCLRILERTGEECERRGVTIPALFVEVPVSDPGRVAMLANVLARHNGEGRAPRVGLKIRTGGLDPAVFPSPAEVAGFVIAARDAGVPMKATAGLHHPVRRFAPEVNTKMHGFLNLFGGAALARAHRWSGPQLTRILEEEDPARFVLDEDGLDWRGFRVDPGGLRDARRLLAVSFGSCSFDEPVEDLEALGHSLTP